MAEENSGFIPEHMRIKNPKPKYTNKTKLLSMKNQKKNKNSKSK